MISFDACTWRRGPNIGFSEKFSKFQWDVPSRFWANSTLLNEYPDEELFEALGMTRDTRACSKTCKFSLWMTCPCWRYLRVRLRGWNEEINTWTVRGCRTAPIASSGDSFLKPTCFGWISTRECTLKNKLSLADSQRLTPVIVFIVVENASKFMGSIDHFGVGAKRESRQTDSVYSCETVYDGVEFAGCVVVVRRRLEFFVLGESVNIREKRIYSIALCSQCSNDSRVGQSPFT